MTFPSWELSLGTRDRHGFGGCWGGRSITNVLTTSSELASGAGCNLKSRAHRWISLGGVGRGGCRIRSLKRLGRDQRSCADKDEENENLKEDCVYW